MGNGRSRERIKERDEGNRQGGVNKSEGEGNDQEECVRERKRPEQSVLKELIEAERGRERGEQKKKEGQKRREREREKGRKRNASKYP